MELKAEVDKLLFEKEELQRENRKLYENLLETKREVKRIGKKLERNYYLRKQLHETVKLLDSERRTGQSGILPEIKERYRIQSFEGLITQNY